MIKTSIVIPVFNSELILPKLILEIANAMEGQSYEVILINDGSTDKSWNVIVNLVNNYDCLKGICLARNFGQDNAIMAGLHHSTGEYVAIMDDDLQHSPYDIIRLRNKCESGFDVCYADYSHAKLQLWWKNFGSYLNAKQAEIIIGKSREIYLSPFKIISRLVVESILQYKNAYPYIDGLIFRSTNSISQIKVEHYKRYASKSNYNLRKSISVFMKHLTGFSIIPLRIATLIGFLTSTLALFLAIYYILIYFHGDVIEGWTTLAVLILLIGGAILMSLGIIGEYIGRIYLVANKRPQFVVRKIIN